MSAHLMEWLNLTIRWVHIITSVAWIGASFYFIWLLNRLEDPALEDKNVIGKLWALHAGGFFLVQKMKLESGSIPEPLHWFKWEAYWTWISGFALLVLIYYVNASIYLINPSVAYISVGTAIAIGLGTLAVGWIIYDFLWNMEVAKNNPHLFSGICFLALIVISYGLNQIFSGRGAYIHIGAMLGTIMAGNVFFIIMPGQRALVAATLAGKEQDLELAKKAALRSLHNNYITLPVLFVMISNHYPSTYGHEYNWLVLIALFVSGAMVRHYFNVRAKKGNWAPSWLIVTAIVLMIVFAVITVPVRQTDDSIGKNKVSFATVNGIIEQRCLSCHSASPTSKLFAKAPKGFMLDTPEQIKAQVSLIMIQSVSSKLMPLGNITQMTEEERTLLGQWIEQGANTK